MPTVAISNWGDAIFLALSNALNTFLAAIPQAIGAALIILIGWVLSNVLGRLAGEAIRRGGADRVFAQHGGRVYGERVARYKPSTVAGEIVRWLVRLIFLVAAANVLGMPEVSIFLNQVLLWIPNLIVAAVILLVAPLVARFVRGAIEVGAGEMGFPNGSLLGRLAEVAIVAFAVVVAVNQIGIATNLVDILFVGLVGALALAFGLAFGLGGREVAAEMTRAWYRSSRETAQRVAARADGGPDGQATSLRGVMDGLDAKPGTGRAVTGRSAESSGR